MGIYSDVLLTADYDRTLTAPDSTIPQRNVEAICYFMENGGAFTVNTGRSVPMARPFLDKVPVNAPLLLYNGSAAYDVQTGKFLFYHEIPLDLWQTVRTCMELFPDMTVEVQGVDAHYRFQENPAWDAFCDHNGCSRGFARPGDDLGPFLKFSVYGQIRDVTVSHLFSGTEEEYRQIDQVQEIQKRLDEFDGIIIGTPVYFSAPSGQLVSFLNRLFYATGARWAGKLGASVVSCRRGGASATFEQLNQYFTLNNMPIVASQYWNSVHGSKPEDVKKDEEGLQTMRVLGQNMAWLLRCIEAGKKQGIEKPVYEPRLRTSFIR